MCGRAQGLPEAVTSDQQILLCTDTADTRTMGAPCEQAASRTTDKVKVRKESCPLAVVVYPSVQIGGSE